MNSKNDFEEKQEINDYEENAYSDADRDCSTEEHEVIIAYKKMRRRSMLYGVLTGALGTITALLIIIAVLTSIGYIGFERNTGSSGNAGAQNNTEASSSSVISESLENKIKYMLYIMESVGLYEVDYDSLVDGMLHGLVNGLDDDYAAYYNEEELEIVNQSNAGTYYGIGVTVQQDEETGLVTVVDVTEDGPAEAAGVQAEDIIYTVGDEAVTGMDINTLVSKIKGEEGTTVSVTFYRPSTGEYLTHELERANLKQIMVYGEMLEDNIGYIRIKNFEAVTYEQLKETIDTLKAQGMEAVVLDLRSNTGGLLTSLVPVANEFLPEGTILTIEDKNGVVEEYKSDAEPFLDLPMVVLVNGYTASAAESLTGAIQDYGVGTIIGTTTFGKGIVQNTYDIGDGTSIKLTIAKYMTPSGRCIQDEGITPDIEVELDDSGTDNQLDKALEVLKEKMSE